MIDALFGSKTRVKLLRLFMSNPGKSFYVREITRLVDEQINSVRRELANMLEVGVIISDSADNKLFYEANQRYEYFEALSIIFGENSSAPLASKVASDRPHWHETLSTLPSVRLLIMSGPLVDNTRSEVDLLVVGTVTSRQLALAVRQAEKIEGRELNYALLDYDDFYYRYSIRDRFVSNIIDFRHEVLADKDNILK